MFSIIDFKNFLLFGILENSLSNSISLPSKTLSKISLDKINSSFSELSSQPIEKI